MESQGYHHLMTALGKLIVIGIVKMDAAKILLASIIAYIAGSEGVDVVPIAKLENKLIILESSLESIVPLGSSNGRSNIKTRELTVVRSILQVEFTLEFLVGLCKRKVVSFVGIESHLCSAINNMAIIDTVRRIVATMDATRTGGNGRSTVLDEKRSGASIIKNERSEIHVKMTHKDSLNLRVVLTHDGKNLITRFIVHGMGDRAMAKNIETFIGIRSEDSLKPGKLICRITLLGSDSISLDIHACVKNNN